MSKPVLVTAIGGQDDAYFARFLLERDYRAVAGCACQKLTLGGFDASAPMTNLLPLQIRSL
jgi:GDP-D-mannose dehydratase